MIRSASEAGALYGSVTPRDIADALAEDARALAENGAFLESRFRPYDFFQAR